MDHGDHRARRQQQSVRGAVAAGLLALLPLAPAAAQVPTVPGVTLPTGIVGEPAGPESGGTTTPTPTTLAPSPPPTSPPATTSPQPARARTETQRTRPAPKVAPPTTVAAVVAPVAEAGEQQASADVGGTGAVPIARDLGFPLALAALVSAFVAVQGRLDRRDPKLAAAPISVDDDLLAFE